MLQENYNKETLGDFYLSPTDLKDKHLIINTINRFINTNPTLKPYANKKRVSSIMQSFAMINELSIMDSSFFAKSIRKYISRNDGTDLAIMYNPKTKEKRIYVKRTLYGVVKEISIKLSLTTLVDFYHTFVTDVVSYGRMLRERKEIINNIINFLKADRLFYQSSNDFENFKIIRYSDVEVVDYIQPIIHFKQQTSNYYTDSIISGSRLTLNDDKFGYTFSSLDEIIKYFSNNIQMIDNIDEWVNKVKQKYSERVAKCYENIDKSKSLLEELINTLH